MFSLWYHSCGKTRREYESNSFIYVAAVIINLLFLIEISPQISSSAFSIIEPNNWNSFLNYHEQLSSENNATPILPDKNNQLLSEMALDLEGNIHVVWIEFNNTASYLRYAMKPRGSIGFSTPIEVDLPVRMKYNATAPKIGVDHEETVHIVWSGVTKGIDPYDIFYTRLVKNGKQFTQPKNLTIEMKDFRCLYPQIDIDSGMKTHVIFYCRQEQYTDTITLYYTYSNDGVLFTKPIKLPYHNFYTLSSYSFKVSERNKDIIYFTWIDQDNKTLNLQLWFGKSTDGGNTFVASRRLSTSFDIQTTPIIIAGNDGLLWIIYRNRTLDDQLEYIQSSNEGEIFNSSTFIANISRCSDLPQKFPLPIFTPIFDVIKSVEGNFLSVVWTEKKGTECEIITKRILEMKATLVEKYKNEDLEYPRIRVWNDNLTHFIWFDNRTGNYQIYYRRFDSSRPIIQHIPIQKSYAKNNISIMANLSDDWGIQNATIYYRDYSSQNYTSIPFTMIKGSIFEGQWNVIIPAPMHDTQIFYYISIFDGINIANTSVNSVEIWSYPPSFIHIPITNASANTTISIKAIAWDDLEVKNVILFFRSDNASFSSVNMKLVNGSKANGTWEGFIPAQKEKTIVSYKIEVNDGTNKNLSVEYMIDIKDKTELPTTSEPNIDIFSLVFILMLLFVLLLLTLIFRRKKEVLLSKKKGGRKRRESRKSLKEPSNMSQKSSTDMSSLDRKSANHL